MKWLLCAMLIIFTAPAAYAADFGPQSNAPKLAEEGSVGGSDSGSDLGDYVIGFHLGASIPTNDLGLFVLPRLEFGYNLPWLGRRIEAFFAIGYNAPLIEGEPADARVPDGKYKYDVRQHELMMGIGVNAHLFELGEYINPYFALAPTLFMLQTVANGEAGGQAFGENTAQATEIGVYTALGADLLLGPGTAFFEIAYTYSALKNPITGDADTGTVSPTLGYRLMF